MARKPMTSKSGKNTNSEKGFALLIAIFILLLLTAIGAGMVTMTNTDSTISSNFRDEQTAYFAAKAGIEEVRDRLRSGTNTISGNTYFTTSNLPGQTNGVLYITNPSTGDTVTPWVTNGAATVYPDDEICTELANTSNPCTGGITGVPSGTWYVTPAVSSSTYYEPATGLKFPWKWARIAAKTNLTSSGTASSGSTVASVDGTSTDVNYRVCWTGSQEVAINASTYASCGAYPASPSPYLPVYVITAMAETPSGSRRMVQAEATMTTFPTIPGPMVFDGASPVYSVPSSNAFGVDGTNYSSPTNANGPGASCSAGQPSEWALGGLGTAAVNTLQTDADTKKPANYTGLPTNPAGGAASVGDVTSQLGTLATIQGLDALVSSVTLVAGNEGNVYTTSNPTIANPGTIANPQVNVVEGDASLGGNWTGAGILLVTGNLTFTGKFTYDGIILVIGKGSVTKNGSGGSMDGSLLVANLYNSAGTLLPATSAPGVPTINWNGGGNFQMNYDSCWSTAMSQSLAWRIVAMREVIR